MSPKKIPTQPGGISIDGSSRSKKTTKKDGQLTEETDPSTPGFGETKLLKQHLTLFNIHLHTHKTGFGKFFEGPANLSDINFRLAQGHPSIPGDQSLAKELESFDEDIADAKNEQETISRGLPVLFGNVNKTAVRCENTLWDTLDAITDGTIKRLKPDYAEGSHRECIEEILETDESLRGVLVPVGHEYNNPVVPNFVMEHKSTRGSPHMAPLQIAQAGVACARAMHRLRLFKREQDNDFCEYDNKAYSFGATFTGENLRLFSFHLVKPLKASRHPRYVTYLLSKCMINADEATFRGALTKLRNLRDLAKDMREKEIKDANDRCTRYLAGVRQSTPLSISPDAPGPGLVNSAEKSQEGIIRLASEDLNDGKLVPVASGSLDEHLEENDAQDDEHSSDDELSNSVVPRTRSRLRTQRDTLTHSFGSTGSIASIGSVGSLDSEATVHPSTGRNLPPPKRKSSISNSLRNSKSRKTARAPEGDSESPPTDEDKYEDEDEDEGEDDDDDDDGGDEKGESRDVYKR